MRYYRITTAYPNVTLTLGISLSDIGYCPVMLSNIFVLGTLLKLYM